MMLVALVLIVIAVVGMWIGMSRQRAALAAATEPLMRAGRVSAPKPAIGTLPNLPPAVERYLRLAIRASKEIQHVRIAQTGMLCAPTPRSTARHLATIAKMVSCIGQQQPVR